MVKYFIFEFQTPQGPDYLVVVADSAEAAATAFKDQYPQYWPADVIIEI